VPGQLDRLWRLARYLGAFGLARGGLFIAPLLIANALPAVDYGRLEFAQAAGSLAASVLGLGTAAAVPLALIQQHAQVRWSALLLHQLHLALWLLLALLGIWLWMGPATAGTMAVLFALSLALQGLWSTRLKSAGRAEASLVMDTGQWLVLALATLGAAALAVVPADRLPWAFGAMLAYAGALLLFTAARWRRAQPPADLRSYRDALHHSVPLMLAGVLALVVTTSGRLGMGLLGGPEMTGAYAALARAAALPVVAHQVVMVARFRALFELPQAALERALRSVVWAVVGAVLVFGLASDPLGHWLGPAFATQFAAHRVAGLTILAQSVLWSAIALNDLVNTRHGAAAASNRWTAACLLLTLPLAAAGLLHAGVTLERYALVHSGVMLAYYLCQAAGMWRAGVRLPTVWLPAVLAFLCLSLLAHVF
jgi:O-antigen/teichoic acid export membrane protein